LAEGASNKARPRGRMVMSVRSPDGALVAERRAGNIVLRGGALLIARLFSGAPGAAAVNLIGIGFARNPGDVELGGLTPPEDSVDLAALRTALPPESFTIVADKDGAIEVHVAAVFKPTRELKDVSEAGLFAGDTLYNQVIFEPVTLVAGQDVTFFWQIDFPFGR
jgi:hypothetical protein